MINCDVWPKAIGYCLIVSNVLIFIFLYPLPFSMPEAIIIINTYIKRFINIGIVVAAEISFGVSTAGVHPVYKSTCNRLLYAKC